MRILVLCHEYPPVGGGGGRVAQDICEGLAASGHQVYVLTAHFKDLPLREEADNLIIQRLPSRRRQAFRADMQAMLGYVLACFKEGFRVIRKWEPDVLHVHFAVPAGAAAWGLSLLTGLPYVLTAHLGDVPGTVPDKTKGWFRWVYPFTPMIWKKAARVTAVSEFTRQSAIQYYPVPIEVVYNGVDLEKLDPGIIQVNDHPRIVFAGRFVHQKNPLQIIEILAAVKHLDWHFTMIGDGPLRPEIVTAISRNELENRISLPGWITPEEVINHFQKSDLLLMPSFSEGLPVVGVQAAALGLALVLSKIGGNIDLVEPGVNGYLLGPNDTTGFKDALQSLLEDPQKLLAFRLASRDLSKRFDLQIILKQYLQVFTEAVQDPRRLLKRNPPR